MTNEINKFITGILIAWLAAGMVSLAWNLYDDNKERETLAFQTARTFMAQLVQIRTWNARYGGVYVPVTSQILPNPYLVDDPQRDLTTVNGQRLTKVNPAFMTRQIAEIAKEQNGAQYHITSLSPVRPENQATDWERKWLEDFQRGVRERGMFITTQEGTQFRYMSPLFVNEACLECHGKQGYGLGDIRGGISLTLPMELPVVNWKMWAGHLAAMAAGSWLILFLGGRLRENRNTLISVNSSLEKEIQERREAQKELQLSKDSLEEHVRQRTIELTKTNHKLLHEVEQRAQAEKTLTAVYDEYYQLFNTAPDSMLVVNQNHEILRVNEAFASLSGLETNQIIGRKCEQILKGTTCRSAECPLNRILQGEERVELETDKVRTDGHTMPCIVTATPFRETDGSRAGMIAVVKDISERKRTEMMLADSAGKLQQSNKALREFAHIVSHDLQEPLMLIQAFCRRLRKTCRTTLTDQGNTYLDKIDSSADRMQELINCLLQYSQVTNKLRQFELVNLQEVVSIVLDDLDYRIQESGATVRLTNLPVVEADPVQMRQLFQNLIGNSLKYHHPDKKPEIHVKASQYQDAADNRGKIRITIRDNGVGFPSEYRNKIFNIFERLPQNGSYQGTGIGLSICRTIVEHHKGSISADGHPGRGAEFTIILPICDY